jgi:hypothetical protein
MARRRGFASQVPELKCLYGDILRAQAGVATVEMEAGSLVVFRKSSEQWPIF